MKQKIIKYINKERKKIQRHFLYMYFFAHVYTKKHIFSKHYFGNITYKYM